ncbi:serine/threonine protein kinase [Bacillus mycoides]|uniref:serine/threonine protein kinase n=1 Tax=Bacillus mycoides TaxID=1405 RepID=UPI0027346D8E|nr:serine/threonine protein kinase [Bacillus mycoides]
MSDAFRITELPKWEEMIKTLFKGDVPLNKEWHDPKAIVEVLNFIGKNNALNHTFLPQGGGLDLTGCKLSNEDGCIELKLESIGHVLKPKKLIFQWLSDADYEWAYFLLELDSLEPSGVYGESSYPEEELVELSPGKYISRGYWDQGEYYGEPLPQEARLIGRYLKGSLVTFSKASLYNANSATYDGRHNKQSAESFKNHIQEAVTYLKQQELK